MRGAGIGQIRVARIPRAGPWLQTRGQERVREHAWLRQESLSSPTSTSSKSAGPCVDVSASTPWLATPASLSRHPSVLFCMQ